MIGVRYRLIPYLYSEYMKAALNELPLFIRKGKAIPVADTAETVKDIDVSTIRLIGYESADYDRYDDDGISTL